MIRDCALIRNISLPGKVLRDETSSEILAKSLSKAIWPAKMPSNIIGAEYSTIRVLLLYKYGSVTTYPSLSPASVFFLSPA